MQGKIVKLISNDYTVFCEKGNIVCKSRGKFRKMKCTPLVGDMVEFDFENSYILKILPRKNELLRPPVSNVDQVFIITSVKEPSLQDNLLDKLLAIIEFHRMKPVICFTKLDLLEDNEKEAIHAVTSYYETIGYPVYFNTELDKMRDGFKDKITVFTGQSGAGKSTLLNHLDESLQIKTGEISLALGRGRHTTRHVELLPLNGGLIADTPGFSSVTFHDMKAIDIRDNFKEFNEYRDSCKYRDCMHDLDDACMIKQMVEEGTILKSRYDNYIKFLREKENEKEKWRAGE